MIPDHTWNGQERMEQLKNTCRTSKMVIRQWWAFLTRTYRGRRLRTEWIWTHCPFTKVKVMITCRTKKGSVPPTTTCMPAVTMSHNYRPRPRQTDQREQRKYTRQDKIDLSARRRGRTRGEIDGRCRSRG